MIDRNLVDYILRLIDQATTYLRNYEGIVKDVADPLRKGRVKVTINDLGLNTNDLAIWCPLRDKNSMSLPKVGDSVEIHFVAGNRNRPVVLGKVTEIDGNIPKAFDGNASTHVLFEEPAGKQKIIYDARGNVIKVGAGSESFLKGNTFDAWLTSFTTWASTHVHATAPVGPVTPPTPLPPAGPTGHLSTKIKGE